ncbi:MAG: hypothetical protein ISS15_05330 [Alphaproteobacteria bacterium]|nr:hypothetical protein [Alphaproteobacteria bacterium]MBL6939458.1 hypothetical protein [Alphaproteobacteria bacterium]MBL7097061.1 hypothetical protein [Alphaproteobacteria bacterium]
MTISFPRTLPPALLARLSVCDFDIDETQESAPTRGGQPIVRDVAPPLWLANFKSARLSPADFKTVDAWLKSLDGSLNTFYAYDLARSYPIAYPNGFTGLTRAIGGAAFDGTATLASVASDNVTPQISGLPASFVMTEGDYLAFDYNSGASRALHQVMAAATGNGSGVINVEVRPHIRPGYGSATILLAQPAGKFVLQPNSKRRQLEASGYGRLEFTGQQTLV